MKIPISEYKIHASVFEWSQHYPILRNKYWCIVNGGFNITSGRTLGHLKKMGWRKGPPDSMLFAKSEEINPKNNNPYIGLAMEFKKDGGYLSAAQVIIMHSLVEEDWKYVVCRSLEQAIIEFKTYLGKRLMEG